MYANYSTTNRPAISLSELERACSFMMLAAATHGSRSRGQDTAYLSGFSFVADSAIGSKLLCEFSVWMADAVLASLATSSN